MNDTSCWDCQCRGCRNNDRCNDTKDYDNICGFCEDIEKELQKGKEQKGKLTKEDMEELREFCSLGCEYSGTKEIVQNIVYETLEEIGGTDLRYADEIGLTDGEDEFATLEDFVNIFWEKAAEDVLNVVETQ